jgi:glycosyltransferase involved in cell wall biosynthesis
LTPTYNRRLFIPQYLKYIYKQDYLGPLEIIIADDGEEQIDDLLRRDPRIRHIRLSERKPLGYKRNLLANEAKGQILINMDDDDYYPSDRVSHAVTQLLKSKLMIAGSSRMFFYNVLDDSISVGGPYGSNHATSATFAFLKEYAATHNFDNQSKAQEEPSFTDKFTAPMCQLEAKSSIVVIQHKLNTWDKSKTTKHPTGFKVKDFIRDINDRRFYKKLAKG